VLDLGNGHGRGRLVDLVYDPILPYPYSVEILETLELFRSERSGVLSQGKNLWVGAFENVFGELVEILPGGSGDNQPISQSETQVASSLFVRDPLRRFPEGLQSSLAVEAVLVS